MWRRRGGWQDIDFFREPIGNQEVRFLLFSGLVCAFSDLEHDRDLPFPILLGRFWFVVCLSVTGFLGIRPHQIVLGRWA